MQFILLSVQKHIMHINKLFSQTSQLKVNIFHKLYHFHNAQNSFIRSVPPFRELYRPRTSRVSAIPAEHTL